MGVYECKIDFNGVPATGVVTVYVRSPPVVTMVTNPAANLHAPSTVLFGDGVTATLSCVFSGDAIGDVSKRVLYNYCTLIFIPCWCYILN